MSTNPFEDENGTYHVLINDEGQHSLWPSPIEIPNGWRIVHKSDTRANCLAFVEKNWTDMRPNSLIEAMNGAAESARRDTALPESSATPDSKRVH